MKRAYLLLLALVALIAFQSCKENETYADKKKKERSAINDYIVKHKIKQISEAEFFAQNNTTDTLKNEWVLMNSTGVYMQIVRKGVGTKMKEGDLKNLLVRFTETNLLTDSVSLSNQWLYFSSLVDHMVVKNISGSYYGAFVNGKSTMYSVYGRPAVPNGWLVPFDYINIGRPTKDGDETAKVRLIIPSASGTESASNNVIPCLYELTIQEE
ncbi:DUF4827 domain-containing protein [Prevotella sp.]|uniref:DUF4827 domain-containing protein n=1 Tax=Prevotella sp. TaxID=59823 RepID=UPI002F9393DA